MKPETYKLFAQVCEGMVFEASTTMDIIHKLPGGPALVKYLHQNAGLGHDQEYTQSTSISWNELKNASRGAWVILKYPLGVGAIKQTGGSYEAIASKSAGGEINRFKNERGGNIFTFLKNELANGLPAAENKSGAQAMFIGNDTGSTAKVKKDRSAARQELEKVKTIDQDAVVAKFKPLWAKAASAAMADVKGMVGVMIKNDAYEKAEKKIKLLQNLERIVDQLEAGGTDTPEAITGAVRHAIQLTASHYYPDETGEITRGGYGSRGYSVADEAGMKHVLSDIAGGDQKKLGTILAFFKRSLISG